MKVFDFLRDALLPPRRSLRQRIMLVLGTFSASAAGGLSVWVYLYLRDLSLASISSRFTLYFTVVAGTLVVGTVIAHLFVRALTRNLERFVAHLQLLPQLPPEKRPFAGKGKDETELVATAFNLLLQERDDERRALHLAEEQAGSAAEAKGRFVATISHELRTPLHGIIGLAQLCLETDLNREQREYLGGILDAGKSLLRTINDLLMLQKIETGQLTLERNGFSLRHLLTSTANSFLPQLREKGLELAFEVPATIPDLLTGDPSRLRQILGNLLDNACKFSERGKVTVGVAPLAEGNDAVELRLFVRDEGRGISPERVDKLLLPFEQGEETQTRRCGGAGLGLAINRQILALMGSVLEVTSAPGSGSTFSFALTFSRQTAPTGGVLPRSADPQGRRALIVCGSPAVGEDLAGQLRRLRMLPLLADPERPLADLPGGKIDLILLDCSVGEQDGWGLVRQIRQHPGCDGLLVLIPRFGLVGDGGRCIEFGVDGYLRRPFTGADFADFIFYLLTHRSPGAIRAGLPPITLYDVEESRYRLTALVVEDIEINRKIVASILLRHGHRVLQAVNGREAVDAWQTNDIDLIFMDVQMPEMDGLEATRLIRAAETASARRRTPIVAVTAGALPEEKAACLAAGMDDYLLKPFELGELRSLLVQAVEAKLAGKPGSKETRR